VVGKRRLTKRAASSTRGIDLTQDCYQRQSRGLYARLSCRKLRSRSK